MKIVSHFGQPDNHVARDRGSDGNLFAWCGEGGFKLPDGDADTILQDAVQRARLCIRCIAAIEAAGLTPPGNSSLPGWNAHPGWAR